jgi:RecA/RadA recombinase
LLKENKNPMLFILDSLGMVPTINDIETDYDPKASISEKARVISKGLQKLVVPLALHNSTFLVLNHLKTNITSNPYERLTDPWFAPGGKTTAFSYSSRIWLTLKKKQDAFIYDEQGNKIGSEIKAEIKKSKFGTFGKTCHFKIIWGSDEALIRDEESWLDVIKDSPSLKSGGAWYTLLYADGTEEKFQSSTWLEKLKEDRFKNRVHELLNEVLIT